jgi:hypothetical protein
MQEAATPLADRAPAHRRALRSLYHGVLVTPAATAAAAVAARPHRGPNLLPGHRVFRACTRVRLAARGAPRLHWRGSRIGRPRRGRGRRSTARLRRWRRAARLVRRCGRAARRRREQRRRCRRARRRSRAGVLRLHGHEVEWLVARRHAAGDDVVRDPDLHRKGVQRAGRGWPARAGSSGQVVRIEQCLASSQGPLRVDAAQTRSIVAIGTKVHVHGQQRVPQSAMMLSDHSSPALSFCDVRIAREPRRVRRACMTQRPVTAAALQQGPSRAADRQGRAARRA